MQVEPTKDGFAHHASAGAALLQPPLPRYLHRPNVQYEASSS